MFFFSRFDWTWFLISKVKAIISDESSNSRQSVNTTHQLNAIRSLSCFIFGDQKQVKVSKYWHNGRSSEERRKERKRKKKQPEKTRKKRQKTNVESQTSNNRKMLVPGIVYTSCHFLPLRLCSFFLLLLLLSLLLHIMYFSAVTFRIDAALRAEAVRQVFLSSSEKYLNEKTKTRINGNNNNNNNNNDGNKTKWIT